MTAQAYANKEGVEIRALDPETGNQEWWTGFVVCSVHGHVRGHFEGTFPSLDVAVKADSPRIRMARDPSLEEDAEEDRRADATPEAVSWTDFRQAAEEMVDKADKLTPLKRPPAPKSKNGHVVNTFVEKVAPPRLGCRRGLLGRTPPSLVCPEKAGESPRRLGDALAPPAPRAPTWRPTCGNVCAYGCLWASLVQLAPSLPISCLICFPPDMAEEAEGHQAGEGRAQPARGCHGGARDSPAQPRRRRLPRQGSPPPPPPPPHRVAQTEQSPCATRGAPASVVLRAASRRISRRDTLLQPRADLPLPRTMVAEGCSMNFTLLHSHSTLPLTRAPTTG